MSYGVLIPGGLVAGAGGGVASSGIAQIKQTIQAATSSVTALTPAFDASIPQTTEGDLVLTATFTPTNASNVLHIFVTLPYIKVTSATVSLAVYKAGTADALVVGAKSSVNAESDQLNVSTKLVAGTTSELTFTVRAGSNGGSLNTGNGAYFGAAAELPSITIIEAVA